VKYMLDTNILIYILKNKPPKVIQHLNALGDDDELCMSFVTYAELLRGAESCTRKLQTLQTLDRLTRQIPVLFGTTRELCLQYAAQFLLLKKAGTPIGGNDLWIACHALSEKSTLVTNNVSEFKRVAGLHIANWTR
jgi:tRNA(fMet)-specific endonuclease VapC